VAGNWHETQKHNNFILSATPQAHDTGRISIAKTVA
jgi:hypothetical protein